MAAARQEHGVTTLPPEETKTGSTERRASDAQFDDVIDLEIASAESPRYNTELVATAAEVQEAVDALSEKIAAILVLAKEAPEVDSDEDDPGSSLPT